MIRWNNDYNKIAHPKVLEAMKETISGSFAGYGADEYCNKASDLIRKMTECEDAGVYFFPGATQANFIVIDAALRPIESVICPDTGHIFCHEAGSIERTSHKVLSIASNDGKIYAKQVEEEASKYYDTGKAEYLTIPKLVYISFATEYGGIYSLSELEEISSVCKKYGMYFFVDGARLGYGLGAKENDVTIKDLARLTDAFYIGGTKCGAMFGEALVVSNNVIKANFRNYMKQSGAVMAKSWLMGVQFYALLKEGLYFDICKQADEYAMQIKEAFVSVNIPFLLDSCTNQQFVLLTKVQYDDLGKNHIFEDMNMIDGKYCVRFCTSWATNREDVEILINDIKNIG